MDAVPHSGILIGKHRSLYLQLLSRVTAMRDLLVTVNGRPETLLLRVNTGSRLHELELRSSCTGDLCRRVEHKVCRSSVFG